MAEEGSPLLLWLITVAGVASCLAGVLAWTGKYRGWLRWYRDPELPFFVRNAALGWMAGGVTLLAGAGAGFAFESGRNGFGKLFIFVFFILGTAQVLLSYLAPSWAIPRWLRELDDAPSPKHPTGDRVFVVIFVGFALLAIIALLSLEYL